MSHLAFIKVDATDMESALNLAHEWACEVDGWGSSFEPIGVLDLQKDLYKQENYIHDSIWNWQQKGQLHFTSRSRLEKWLRTQIPNVNMVDTRIRHLYDAAKIKVLEAQQDPANLDTHNLTKLSERIAKEQLVLKESKKINHVDLLNPLQEFFTDNWDIEDYPSINEAWLDKNTPPTHVVVMLIDTTAEDE